MGLEHLLASLRLGAGRNADKSHDPMMSNSPHDRQLAEVLIKRNEDSLLVAREDEEGFVTRIFGPVSDPDDVVPAGAKFRRGLPPYACVQQELHFVGWDSMVSGSIRSCPT